MDEDLSRSEREVLKALWRAGRGGEQVSTGVLAESLKVSPPTVSATLKRLAARGFVEHRPYQGAVLAAAGARPALLAIRRHRIVERFLSDFLGYPWSAADRLAAAFEFALASEVVERLFVALGRPETCPHGFPIPDEEPVSPPVPIPSLWALEPGQRATVALAESTEPEVARFLETLGLVPGAEVVVEEKLPFDGPVLVRVAGATRTLGDRLARQIFVLGIDALSPEGAKPTGEVRDGDGSLSHLLPALSEQEER